MLCGHRSFVRCMVFWKDKLVSGSWDRSIKVWNLVARSNGSPEGRECERTLRPMHKSFVNGICGFGEVLLSASSDSVLRVWNKDTWKCEGVLDKSEGAGFVGPACDVVAGLLVTGNGSVVSPCWSKVTNKSTICVWRS